jgi:hypothetical protein
VELPAQIGVERARRIRGIDFFGREKTDDGGADFPRPALSVQRHRQVGERLQIARGIVHGGEGGEPPLSFGAREVSGAVRRDSLFPALARVVPLRESRRGEDEEDGAQAGASEPADSAPAPGDEEDTAALAPHRSRS